MHAPGTDHISTLLFPEKRFGVVERRTALRGACVALADDGDKYDCGSATRTAITAA
ncbi:hypothetical protein [Burkholderia sp. Nafp2/4-1b]|uniref:hypothetical protein n=1 Tax=Burkholderia sp. Nafp2/4-1b TaxID=2116686 RepID=UPI0013CEF469|nr:hypothetical protein [Burkholderia sp. Nafp2/4-1b]